MYVNSKNRRLNTGQIIAIFLRNNPQPYPPAVMMSAIVSELSQDNVYTRQIGNTLFEIMPGKDGQGFFKAFNADVSQNFVDNSKRFVVWAKEEMGMKVLVTQFKDPAIETLFKIIAEDPPMEGMGYQVVHMKSGETRIVLNLGD
jgi:hypothetical protein